MLMEQCQWNPWFAMWNSIYFSCSPDVLWGPKVDNQSNSRFYSSGGSCVLQGLGVTNLPQSTFPAPGEERPWASAPRRYCQGAPAVSLATPLQWGVSGWGEAKGQQNWAMAGKAWTRKGAEMLLLYLVLPSGLGSLTWHLRLCAKEKVMLLYPEEISGGAFRIQQ